jgi:CRP/FNR family transcriptional regulator, cyclic AMP receptor protein
MKKIPIGPDEISQLSQALRKISFFQGISMGDLERFINITNLYEYPSGKAVFKKGSVGDALYVVHAGSVRIINRPFPFWPAKTLAILGPGELFGEMALIDQPYRTATVVTEGPTKLFVVLNTHFNELLQSNPEFARDIRRMAQQRAFESRGR